MATFAEIELWRAPVDATEERAEKRIDGSIPPIISRLVLRSVFAVEFLLIIDTILPHMVRPYVPHDRPAVAVVFWDSLVRFSPWVQATGYSPPISQRVSYHARQSSLLAVSPIFKVRCIRPVGVSTPHMISNAAVIRKGENEKNSIFFSAGDLT